MLWAELKVYLMIRVPTHKTPTHPGEMLLEEFLNSMAITQRELADAFRQCDAAGGWASNAAAHWWREVATQSAPPVPAAV